MNILVISGGSGNDSLITGLKKFYPDSNIRVLVNAYDNGKSTGVCRAVTNTLGVSDIRKNHIRMYKATNPCPDKRLVEFFEDRYNFTPGNEVEEISAKLTSWGLHNLVPEVEDFFTLPTAHDYTYTDFNVANIVYSVMYSKYGYEQTNKHFCDLLGIEDFVILNSFDNVFIKAITESAHIIEDEGDLVEWCNPEDKICRIEYTGNGVHTGLNLVATDAISGADLIIISTGTFWSSIFPTLDYEALYDYINESSAKKVWAINNEEDKDAFGVSSTDFIRYLEDLGLDLSPFTIIENADAAETLRKPCEGYDIHLAKMGNVKGKHDGLKYARAVLKCYYGITSPESFSKVFLDFDDTVWSRKDDGLSVSRKNIELVGKLQERAVIVSGNSYASISNKIASVYGSSLNTFVADIWADANAVLYNQGVSQGAIESMIISGDIYPFVDRVAEKYGLMCTANSPEHPTFIKLKPFEARERAIFADYLNDYLLGACGLGYCKALVTGRTTIDIVVKNNNKAAIAAYYDCDNENVLYIGDEVDTGNDQDIASLCGTSIHVANVYETNVVLRLLLEEE